MNGFQRALVSALSFIFLIGTVHNAAWGATGDGGRPGEFLDYAASARSLGMGQAHVGVADDASATYWNPAGLSQLGRKDFVTMYSLLQEDTNFGFASYAQPTQSLGSIGVSVVSIRSGNFTRRDASGADNGSFGTSSTALLLSNSVGIGPRLSIGGTLKAIRQQVDTASANGYGADLGAMAYLHPLFQMGIVLRNVLAPSVKLSDTADKYPREARVGASWRALRALLIAADVDLGQKQSAALSAGAEYKVTPLLALRTGVSSTEIAAGLGIALGDWTLDYAFGYPITDSQFRELGDSHKFGLHLKFGVPLSDKTDRFGWRKEGKVYLTALGAKMDAGDDGASADTQHLVTGAKAAIQRDGYQTAGDLYAAQAYVYYFQGDYPTSVSAFQKAVEADPTDEALKRRLTMAQSKTSTEKREEVGDFRLKDARALYAEGDWMGAVKACENILALTPGNPEATAYLAKARNKIVAPELKIGKKKFDEQNYVDAYIHFKKVKDVDPDNAEATAYLAKVNTLSEAQANKKAATSDQSKGQNW